MFVFELNKLNTNTIKHKQIYLSLVDKYPFWTPWICCPDFSTNEAWMRIISSYLSCLGISGRLMLALNYKLFQAVLVVITKLEFYFNNKWLIASLCNSHVVLVCFRREVFEKWSQAILVNNKVFDTAKRYYAKLSFHNESSDQWGHLRKLSR